MCFLSKPRYLMRVWHEKIKFISSSRRVMFFLLYRQKDIDIKIIDFYSPKSNSGTAQIYSTAIQDIVSNNLEK